MIDPFQRTRQERTGFAKDAASYYTYRELHDIKDLFRKDFFFWTKAQFNSLSNVTINKIRNSLLSEVIPNRKRPGLRMSKALVDYVENIIVNGATKKRRLSSNEYNGSKSNNEFKKGSSFCVKLSASDSKRGGVGKETRSVDQSRPGNVSKLFAKEMKYSGAPTEPIQQRFRIFLNSYRLCGVDEKDKIVVLPLLETTFLQVPALMYFLDEVLKKVQNANKAIEIIEAHLL